MTRITSRKRGRDGCILNLRKSRPLLFISLVTGDPVIIRLQKSCPVWIESSLLGGEGEMDAEKVVLD